MKAWHRWSEQDLAFLRANAHCLTARQIGEHLERGRWAVLVAARYRGIKLTAHPCPAHSPRPPSKDQDQTFAELIGNRSFA